MMMSAPEIESVKKPAIDITTPLVEQFPILRRRVHGARLVYLDNAASTQKPRCVIDAMSSMMTQCYANVHRGLYVLACEATHDFENARNNVATFLGAADTKQIVFTSGGTDALNLVAHGIGLNLKQGDEIILSIAEHHSNIVPWHFLRERLGVVLRWVRLDAQGRIDLDHYRSLFNARTSFVSLTHMSNVLGFVNPIREAADIAHAHGVQIMADGCQAAGHIKIDVKELDVDYYAITGHKLYGPTGVGALYGKTEALASLAPFRGGGEMIETVSTENVTYAKPPQCFEAGTPPIVEVIGFGASLRWMMAHDYAGFFSKKAALSARLRAYLRERKAFILGPDDVPSPVVTFSIEGIHPHDVASMLDNTGIAVRAGNHCAQPLGEAFKAPGTIRVSFGVYNDMADVEAFIFNHDKVLRLLGYLS